MQLLLLLFLYLLGWASSFYPNHESKGVGLQDLTDADITEMGILKAVATFMERNPRPGTQEFRAGQLVDLSPLTPTTLFQAYFKGVHFVDRHREALIKRTPIVAPILDALLTEKMIHQELYTEIVTATTTPQNKMRMLFLATTAWGTKQKDYFYKILEREQPFLIEELQTS
ncbi:Apoptosis-associated speck-like protein containing a CARD [Acipenser ruthenus]|uniref:Apoptosis-associated speck-like protein containing a CARD n=1 Tax=Acipenser ruthenus TaxID=7906 RepID=A0A444UYL2_ACIRT|nr:Apoptosis-associated speck-like protein containing a CARD [Acipenser ruthenus]